MCSIPGKESSLPSHQSCLTHCERVHTHGETCLTLSGRSKGGKSPTDLSSCDTAARCDKRDLSERHSISVVSLHEVDASSPRPVEPLAEGLFETRIRLRRTSSAGHVQTSRLVLFRHKPQAGLTLSHFFRFCRPSPVVLATVSRVCAVE